MMMMIKSDRLQWHAQTLSNLLHVVNGLVLWLIAQLADCVISLFTHVPAWRLRRRADIPLHEYTGPHD